MVFCHRLWGIWDSIGSRRIELKKKQMQYQSGITTAYSATGLNWSKKNSLWECLCRGLSWLLVWWVGMNCSNIIKHALCPPPFPVHSIFCRAPLIDSTALIYPKPLPVKYLSAIFLWVDDPNLWKLIRLPHRRMVHFFSSAFQVVEL